MRLLQKTNRFGRKCRDMAGGADIEGQRDLVALARAAAERAIVQTASPANAGHALMRLVCGVRANISES